MSELRPVLPMAVTAIFTIIKSLCGEDSSHQCDYLSHCGRVYMQLEFSYRASVSVYTNEALHDDLGLEAHKKYHQRNIL